MLLVVAMMYSFPADALSCAEPPAAKEEFDTSSYIFRGKVMDKKQTDQGPKVTFRILEIWKGTAYPEIDIFVSDMWLVPDKGKQYLIYASNRNYAGKKDDELWANICGRTAEWDSANGDIHQFGKPGMRLSGTEDGISPLWIISAGSVLFLVICLIYMLTKKRKKGDSH